MTDIEFIIGYIRPDKLGAVKRAIAKVGVPSLTVTNVLSWESQPMKKSQWRGEEYTVDLYQKVKVEYVVADIPESDVVDAITDAAKIGEPGDDKVSVVPVEEAHQFRTGASRVDAV